MKTLDLWAFYRLTADVVHRLRSARFNWKLGRGWATAFAAPCRIGGTRLASVRGL